MPVTQTRSVSAPNSYRQDYGDGGGGGFGNRRTGFGGDGGSGGFDPSWSGFSGGPQMTERDFAMQMETSERIRRGLTVSLAQERNRGLQQDLAAERHNTRAKQQKVKAAARGVAIAKEKVRQQDLKLQLQETKSREVQVEIGIVRDKVGAMIVERQLLQNLHAANLSGLNLNLGERLGRNSLRSDVLTYKGLLGGSSSSPFNPHQRTYQHSNNWNPPKF